MSTESNPDIRTTFLGAVSSERTLHAHIADHVGLSYTSGSLTQDRHTIEEWIMPNGSWTFASVLDGHGGSEAAEFVAKELPPRLKDLLATELNQSPQFHLDDAAIARLLIKVVTEVDSRIADDFKSLLPENFGEIAAGDVVSALKDPASVDGSPRIEVLRALSGTTISIALIDPSKAIHVANVGDCDVFLCTNTQDGWQSNMLGSNHNCKNPTEVARIRAEHPNEEHCVVTNEAGITRVLRCLNLSRALGDMPFKFSTNYNQMLNLIHPIDPRISQHSITPPYISNVPDIKHVHPSTSPSERKYLFLSSDGLVDMFKLSTGINGVAFADACASIAASAQEKGQNMAVEVLWQAFGGESGEDNLYGQMLSGGLRKGGRLDDVTVIVLPM